jgi:3-oxoadipate enol-lactonase
MAVCEIHHVLEGPADAPVVVLAHPLGGDLRTWERQVGDLSERFRVLRYDMRGHGSSPVPIGPYSLAELGGDLLALLDRLDIAEASICGVSVGGATAMWTAAHAPERVRRLVVCFSSASFGEPAGWLVRAALVRAQGMQTVADGVVGRWLTAAMAREHPQLIAQLRERVAATAPEGYASTCEAMAEIDLREDLAAIDAPTLVISGSEDPATPPEHGRRIAEAIGGRFVEIQHAAHLGNFEQPELVNTAILAHLARESPQTRPKETST